MGGAIAKMVSLSIENAIETKGTAQRAKDLAALSFGSGSWDGTQFGAFWQALGLQESGGNYGAVNASTGALGKYQVMPFNVGPWSKQALGRSISTSEFLNSPELQDKIVKNILGGYFEKWGPRGAAAAWYAGPANHDLHMSTRPQPGGPPIKTYVDSIMAKMERIMASTPGVGSGGVPGKTGGVWPGMGWKRQFALVKKAFPSRAHPDPGQTDSGGHATNSYHYKGRAVDLGSAKDPSVPLGTLFNWLYKNYGSQSTQIIYGPAANRNILNGQHFNYGASTNSKHMGHIHWAMRNGGIVPGRGVGDRTHIMGEPGEFMLRKKAVEKVGPDFLRMLNSDRFINMPDRAVASVGSKAVAGAVDNSVNAKYDITIDARGNQNADDIGKAVEDALLRIEQRQGLNRRIGSN